MLKALLEHDDSIGFCTYLETTKSPLFARALDVTSDSLGTDDLWFRVYIPPANSLDFAQMCELPSKIGRPLDPSLQDATPIFIEVPCTVTLLAYTPEKQAKLASKLANQFLRAFEHTYFDLSVPRHRLDGRPIVKIDGEIQVLLDYKPIILNLNDVLSHYLPGHTDIEQLHLEILMGSPEFISPSWRILVDGARHFENGNYREAVLCACSAAEIVASPAVGKWLEGNTLGGDNVENAVRELGNPLRFNLCLSGACTDAFAALDTTKRAELLAELRGMNSLRNRVVHRGEEPEATATTAALSAAAAFVCATWLATLGSGKGLE